MTVSLRLDPWTLQSRNDTAAALRGRGIVSLPPRMIDPPCELDAGRIARRRKIWELSSHLHCSIVGTCLSTGELRQVLVKAGMANDAMSEHDLHRQGVTLAGQRDGLAKLLHKAIDRRHRSTLGRFDKAGTVDEVRTLWQQAVAQGDIPGAYWAVMTHATANDTLIRDVFGEVHMLSHLVGAANRADIRRLSELEAENARLRDKLARQQDHLRDGITARDTRIRELGDLLARQMAERPADDEGAPETTALRELTANLEQRLRSETSRRIALEERLARMTDGLGSERSRRAALERSEADLRDELAAVEAGFGPEAEAGQPPPSLNGLSVLYVGGRTDRLGHLRASCERLGAAFLHHDGGVEDRSGLLGGLVSRADIVMFPVDCVSHEAVTNVKRLCRQLAKPFMPLRSSGMGSFVAALGRTAVRPS